jgi:hypothetical protein
MKPLARTNRPPKHHLFFLIQPDTDVLPPELYPPASPGTFCTTLADLLAEACGASAFIHSHLALVAIHANRGVVGIAVDSTVMIVRRRFVGMRRIPRVAGTDTGENRVVRRTDVAIRTGRAIVRNPEIGVVEDRTQPRRGHISGVAAYAGCRVRRGYVIRDVRAIGLRIGEVRLVAAVAIRRRISRRIVAAQVAVRTRVDHWADRAGDGRARRQHVRTLQREARRAVVKLAIRPENGVVAGGAE